MPKHKALKYRVITDDEIIDLFEGTNFGDKINNCAKMKRRELFKSVRDKQNGYWTGHTAFNIMLNAGLVQNGLASNKTNLTTRGYNFLNQEAHNEMHRSKS